jgi:hypothetical protein
MYLKILSYKLLPFEDGTKMLQYLIDGILPGFGLPKALTFTCDGWTLDVTTLRLYYRTIWVTTPDSRSVVAIRCIRGNPVVLLDDYMEHSVFCPEENTGMKCENLQLYLTD